MSPYFRITHALATDRLRTALKRLRRFCNALSSPRKGTIAEMVGAPGIEPGTPTVSRWCSPAELHARRARKARFSYLFSSRLATRPFTPIRQNPTKGVLRRAKSVQSVRLVFPGSAFG